MKTSVFRILMLVAGFATTAAAGEVTVEWRHIMPAKNEDWDSAGGAEIQFRVWNEDAVALALSVGMEKWRARRESYEEAAPDGYYSISVGGDLTAIPMGVSLLYELAKGQEVSWVLEAGLKYVFCDSDINVESVLDDALGLDSFRDPVEVDNALIGVLGVQMKGAIDEDVWITLGAGYQTDLIKPDERFLDDDIGSTSLRGAYLTAGLAWSF